jgi:copper(I)-binding protein
VSSSLRRGAPAAAAIVFSIASLAACGAGNNAQTLEIKPDNAATTVGDIQIQNALVITQPVPESTGPLAVSATLFNNGRTAQTLDAISIPGDGSAEISPAKGEGKGKVTIPAGGSVVIGGEDNASAVLADPGGTIKAGDAQEVTFTFSEAGDVTLRAFVFPAESYFSEWGPSEVPRAPGATPAPSGTLSGSASGEEHGARTGADASSSPSASGSGAASGH